MFFLHFRFLFLLISSHHIFPSIFACTNLILSLFTSPQYIYLIYSTSPIVFLRIFHFWFFTVCNSDYQFWWGSYLWWNLILTCNWIFYHRLWIVNRIRENKRNIFNHEVRLFLSSTSYFPPFILFLFLFISLLPCSFSFFFCFFVFNDYNDNNDNGSNINNKMSR